MDKKYKKCQKDKREASAASGVDCVLGWRFMRAHEKRVQSGTVDYVNETWNDIIARASLESSYPLLRFLKLYFRVNIDCPRLLSILIREHPSIQLEIESMGEERPAP